MTGRPFDAVIFDLDGVITATASVHAAAWKETFDEYMRLREAREGEPFREFTHRDDYLPFVDGKPRYQGVASFLQSRGVDIPFGDPSDGPDVETVCGIGNRKADAFEQVLERDGVQVYPSTVELMRSLHEEGYRVGVASSSKNCEAVLRAAGLLDLCETRIDGVVSAQLGLNGKPAPDIFTTAADELGVPYDRAVVVEDAVSGVQAGVAGNFGLVLGVAREDNEESLWRAGADLVVSDIGELGFDGIRQWFTGRLPADGWTLSYRGYLPEEEGTRETLTTLGNGVMATRGAMEETAAGGASYPGTYIAGVYNRLTSEVAGRSIDNEDLVNCPNWLATTFRIEDGPWFEPSAETITECYRRLDLRRGVLSRVLTVCDSEGRETRITSLRVVSMAQPHLCALRYSVQPLNWTGRLEIRSALDGDIENAGVPRYRQLASQHLMPGTQAGQGDRGELCCQTTESGTLIALCCRLTARVDQDDARLAVAWTVRPGVVEGSVTTRVDPKRAARLEKVVAIRTSLGDRSDPRGDARATLESAPDFAQIAVGSAAVWEELWRRFDIRVAGDRQAQRALRVGLYHTFVSASPHHTRLDAGIAARGLHGEAYRGHIFWDELFALPLFAMHLPKAARSVLMYRHRRLGAARRYAAENGYRGAMFPWQSGTRGTEETQELHLNPRSGEWGPDHSRRQRHVSLAVAYNAWTYGELSGDHGFVVGPGADLIVEICRFWVSVARWNETRERFEIAGVMGPDEYHEMLPGAAEAGLRNNAYTNVMVSWLLERAGELLTVQLDEAERADVMERLDLTERELGQWERIRTKLAVSMSEEGVLERFEGYFGLEELDMDPYRRRYGSIGRLDRILKAEGKSPDAFKVAKQADTLMLFYLLPPAVVGGLLETLGHDPPGDLLRRNLDYYLPRTCHGSTLSKLVHAHVAHQAGYEGLALTMFREALLADLQDVQGGTTREGIHLGAMAGSARLVVDRFGGLDLTGHVPRIRPALPPTWRHLAFSFAARGHRFELRIEPATVRIRCDTGQQEVEIWGRMHTATSRWTEVEKC